MKILITGGTGYIGSHTTVELIKDGHQVVIVDNLSNSNLSVLDAIEKITSIVPEFEQFDLTNVDKTADFFARHKDIDGIIHFAASKYVGESVENPLKYYQNNLYSLINVTVSFPANVIALRYFNPIGAHESALIGELPVGVPQNLIPFVTQTAIGIRQQLSVYGSDYNTLDGTCIRDYIHVVDLAKAHVVAVERLVNGNTKNPFEVFNIGTGNGYTVLQVIEAFERVSGKKLNYKLVDRRPGDVEKVWADTTFANNELGWKSEKSLDEMLLSAWNWEKKLAEAHFPTSEKK